MTIGFYDTKQSRTREWEKTGSCNTGIKKIQLPAEAEPPGPGLHKIF